MDSGDGVGLMECPDTMELCEACGDPCDDYFGLCDECEKCGTCCWCDEEDG